MVVMRALSVDRQVSTHPHQRAEEKEEDDRCDPAHAGEVHAELSLAVAIAKWSVSIESLNLNRKSQSQSKPIWNLHGVGRQGIHAPPGQHRGTRETRRAGATRCWTLSSA